MSNVEILDANEWRISDCSDTFRYVDRPLRDSGRIRNSTNNIWNEPTRLSAKSLLGVRRFSLLAASPIELNLFGETTRQIMRITFRSATAGASRT